MSNLLNGDNMRDVQRISDGRAVFQMRENQSGVQNSEIYGFLKFPRFLVIRSKTRIYIFKYMYEYILFMKDYLFSGRISTFGFNNFYEI